jgi:hypothetical protein
MDTTDFSKGINTDVDAQDAHLGGYVRDAVNFDFYPGKARKRYGTEYVTFSRWKYTPSTKTLSSDTPNLIPFSGQPQAPGYSPSSYDKEEVVQIVRVYAPDAKKGKNTPKSFPATEEHCDNDEVTIIMTRCIADSTRYYLYADCIEKDKFIKVSAGPGGVDYITAASSTAIPFMIPRQSAVAIGNVLTFKDAGGGLIDYDAPGVIWLGHIKRSVGWNRTTGLTGAYKWLQHIDEWRLCNSECYYDTHPVQLMIGSAEKAWNATNPTRRGLENMYALTGGSKQLYDSYLDPLTLGGNEAKTEFRLKVTADYDGYQESRPLKWNHDIRMMDTDVVPNFQFIEPVFPQAWQCEFDPLYNQYARLRLGESQSRCVVHLEVLSADPAVHPFFTPGFIGYNPDGTTWPGSVDIIVRWNNPYFPDVPMSFSGEGFILSLYNMNFVNTPIYAMKRDTSGQISAIQLNLGNVAGVISRMGSSVPSTSTGHGEVTGSAPPGNLPVRVVELMLGSPFTPLELQATQSAITESDFIDGIIGTTATTAHLRSRIAYLYNWLFTYGQLLLSRTGGFEPLNELTRLMTYTDTVYTIDSGFKGDVFFAPYGWMKRINYSSADLPSFSHGGSELFDQFEPEDFAGKGIVGVLPKFDPNQVLADSFDTSDIILLGQRRITGVNIYLQERDTDLDYRMVSEIDFNYREDHVDFGGAPNAAVVNNVSFGYREGYAVLNPPSGGTAPTWQVFNNEFMPYYMDKFNTDAPNLLGIKMTGALNQRFLINDSVLTDTEGKSLLSGNMLREENKTDRPDWIRGALCEGRMICVSNKNRLQYSLVAGGRAQYDIMPADFHVAKGEVLSHIVSWRGQHHLIFTETNIWRIDLADGDEFSWRILDTFSGRGTKLWRSIAEAPTGVLFVNDSGIYLYEGNMPQSLTDKVWSEDFKIAYTGKLNPATSHAGYNTEANEYWISLENGLDPAPPVHIFSPKDMSWRRYSFVYDDDLMFVRKPRMMAMHDGRWLVSFEGAGDLRRMRYGFTTDILYRDGSIYEKGYSCYIKLSELPPPSETMITYWLYAGVRFSSEFIDPYLQIYRGGYKDEQAETIRLSKNRIARFFPIALGIGRGTGIVFYSPQHEGMVVLSSVSFRAGQPEPQWFGTSG